MNTQEALAILKRDFGSELDSFTALLHDDLIWDRNRFLVLVRAMETICVAFLEQDTVPKWLAEGYWFYPLAVEEWVSHSIWGRKIDRSDDYYQSAIKYFHELATSFFEGQIVSQMPDILQNT